MENSQQPTKQERRELRRQEKINAEQQRKRKHLYKRFTLWSAIVLVMAGAIFGIIQLAKLPADNGAPVSVAAIAENDWVKGNREAKVILIEYSDFQCPACAAYYPLVKQLAQEFADDAAFVYRHFPLGIFPNSRIAGQAAESAGRQGKFWEMHSMIFDGQREWSNQNRGQAEEIFTSYAERLNLDVEQFKNDFNSQEAKDKINSDHRSGLKARVNATPTFFLNGERIRNPRSYEEFKSIINQAIGNNL
jgi:protein-disulfide isomerase